MPDASARRSRSARPTRLSERAANLLEQDIISPERLAPGARLGIVDLVQRYEIGATPLREGLVAAGVARADRRHRPARLSRCRLSAATILRISPGCARWSRLEALRLAIERGDDAWEAGIVGALHQMRRHIERTGDDFREGAPDFDRLHKGFHTALLAACGSQRLLGRAFRSLRPGLSLPPRDDAQLRRAAAGSSAVHQKLADRVLARRRSRRRDPCWTQHLHSTLDFVYPPDPGS